MSMIKVEHLTFSYPSSYENIFEDISFQIDTDWRLGFVGRNGRGKTTLLKLLMGNYEYRGKIISSVEFDYFSYPVQNRKRWTGEILQEICPQAEEWEFMRELTCLDVEVEVLWKPFNTLSNGEQTKALLAALFLKEGNFLLIDEPTNHLDLSGREKVAEYLRRKKGFILVSHDRHFLDRCVDHVLSINRATIDVQSGSFSAWMEGFQQQQESEAAYHQRLQKEIGRMQKSARQKSVWSDRVEASKIGAADKGFVGHKAAKMMKRSKSIEARQQKAIEQKAGLLKNIERAEELKITPMQHHSKKILSVSEAVPCYDGIAVSDPISFDIEQGQRIAVDGGNGSGKSSLLKLLAGNDLEHTGIVTAAPGLVVSYVPQDASFLRGSLSDFAQQQGIDESLLKTILRKMGFERIQFEKCMEDFSEGQKKKVLLAGSLCQTAHLYIWDEPLNFIDLYSRMQIEELILNCSPTLIFVEHDKTFRDRIATETVVLS